MDFTASQYEPLRSLDSAAAATPQGSEPINAALARHQAEVGDWRFAAAAADLQKWASRMIVEFKLEIGTPALTIEPLGCRWLGHFRPGRNGFGLRDEIAINDGHLACSEYWRVLGTLAHELLHSWQENHGKPGKGNYHNKQFRAHAERLGLIIDTRGVTQYTPPPTPFWRLLDRYGVKAPSLPTPVQEQPKCGTSKLRLYQCPCGIKVRSGRSTLRVRCMECNGVFVRSA